MFWNPGIIFTFWESKFAICHVFVHFFYFFLPNFVSWRVVSFKLNLVFNLCYSRLYWYGFLLLVILELKKTIKKPSPQHSEGGGSLRWKLIEYIVKRILSLHLWNKLYSAKTKFQQIYPFLVSMAKKRTKLCFTEIPRFPQ